MTIEDFLRSAWKLIDQPEKLAREAFHLQGEGGVQLYCAMGAIGAIDEQDRHRHPLERDMARGLLRRASKELFGTDCVPESNDDRGWAAVALVYARALRLATGDPTARFDG